MKLGGRGSILWRLILLLGVQVGCTAVTAPPAPPLLTPSPTEPATFLPFLMSHTTITPTPPPVTFYRGVDASFLPQVEANGGLFYDAVGQDEALAIFARQGINSIRLRVWVSPTDGHSGTAEILALAQRIRTHGLGLLLDIHYSDTWADPGHQIKPAAWANMTQLELETAVHDYTRDLLLALQAQNTPPDIVQIGNEITAGILWENGRVGTGYEDNWPQLAALLQAGLSGLQEALAPTATTRLMLHLDAGGNNATCRWFLDNLRAQGITFDLLGLSYYPWWHGSLDDLRANLQDLSQRYPYDIIVVETAYPWTLAWNDNVHNLIGLENQLLPGYPATPQGQAEFLHDLQEIVQTLPAEKGIGLYYWAADYITTPQAGSFWENVALFDFNGQSLPALHN